MQRFKERLGCIIRKQRKNMNITQEQLAEQIGVTTGSIGQYERGETMPTVENLKLLLECLAIDPGEVFSGEYDINSEVIELLHAFKRMKPIKRKFMLNFAQFLIDCEYDEDRKSVAEKE